METWEPALNGSLFTEEGYSGIGQGTGNNVYAIGEYGSWPWQDKGKQEMWDNSDEWVLWFDNKSFATTTDYFLYLIDESEDYAQIEEWAAWIDQNPGPGSRLKSLATISLPIAAKYTPSLDIPTSWVSASITNEWEAAASTYTADPDKSYYLYNSNRPGSGSFAIEDGGIALRELAWGQYKKGAGRWFYWESTYYQNFQCYGYGDPASHTNVFLQAQTYGCIEGLDENLGQTGWNYLNGDGVLFYPGTDHVYPNESYGVNGPFASLRLKYWRRGIQDADYISMAAKADPKRTQEIVQRMVPSILWEVGVSDHQDPTYVYADISWPTDPDDWEAARLELADIIEGKGSTR